MQNTLTEDLITTTRANLVAHSLTTLDAIRTHSERIATFSPEVEAERLQEKTLSLGHSLHLP